MAANTADFLGGGDEFVSPFGNAPSQAPASGPDDQPNPNNPGGLSNNELRRRQAELERQGNDTANINAPGLANRATPQTARSGYENQVAAERAGMSLEDYQAMRAREREHSQGRSTLRNIFNDPVTLGVLSAPYAVVGGGAAVGGAAALGFGEAAAAGGGTLAAAAPEAGSLAAGGGAAGVHGAGIGAAAAGNAVAPLAATGAVAAPVAAGGTAAAAPAAAGGGITAGNVIDAAGLAGTLGIAALDQRKTAAEKQLLAKQEQMAAEAKQRQQQMQTAGMNALGQRLLAFNPQNQMMAQMYGPQSAFAPEQFAAMAENPMKPPPGDPEAAAKFAQEEEQRRQMIMNGITPVGQGPAPIQPRTPQAARKF